MLPGCQLTIATSRSSIFGFAVSSKIRVSSVKNLVRWIARDNGVWPLKFGKFTFAPASIKLCTAIILPLAVANVRRVSPPQPKLLGSLRVVIKSFKIGVWSQKASSGKLGLLIWLYIFKEQVLDGNIFSQLMDAHASCKNLDDFIVTVNFCCPKRLVKHGLICEA